MPTTPKRYYESSHFVEEYEEEDEGEDEEPIATVDVEIEKKVKD
jgi:hypothetical protein